MNLPGSILTPALTDAAPTTTPKKELREIRGGTSQLLFNRLIRMNRPLQSPVISFHAARQTLTIFEPLRQTVFVTTAVLILAGLFSLVGVMLLKEASGEQLVPYERPPYRVSARRVLTSSSRWPTYLTISSSKQQTSPHPAVARIVVPEGMATAYGTGTLVDIRDEFGLVVTNWHVVRDATGVVEVVFPNGFRSQARALKVDPDWDLAALVIWRPPVEPVKLAASAPRPGEALTIHGYGQGEYRVARGACTQYYAPRPDFPQEMVELNVEAREGDSGGPIFDDRGELAGVLFGAGQGTTIGSFGGRVESFLASLAPDIGRPVAANTDGTLLADGLPNFTVTPHQDGSYAPPRGSTAGNPEPTSPIDGSVRISGDWQPASDDHWSISAWQRTGDETFQSGAPAPSQTAAARTDVNAAAVSPSTRSLIVNHVKSVLAIIGLYTVCIHAIRIVS